MNVVTPINKKLKKIIQEQTKKFSISKEMVIKQTNKNLCKIAPLLVHLS